MTSPEIWRQFAHDPRSPAYGPMRAADADRDVVLGALGEAYAEGRINAAEFDERTSAVQAARTLGELPAFLDDLVPALDASPATVSSAATLSPQVVEAQAVARWERSRREALTMWVFVSLVCWVIWFVTNNNAHPWPVYPMLGTSLPLLGTLIQRKDMIESNRRKIVAKHEKAAAKEAKRRALEQQKRREIEGRRDQA
ncbi:MAG: DUF1707 SHOCT-like domain-containing protein [Nocardioides sp.]